MRACLHNYKLSMLALSEVPDSSLDYIDFPDTGISLQRKPSHGEILLFLL